MAIYTIEDTTTGQVFKIEGPEGASDYELQQFMSTQFQEEEEEPVDDDIGLGRSLFNATARFGVNLASMPKQIVGEQLAQISDLKRDRLAREAEGDISAFSRLNTGLSRNNETPDQLDQQAAGYLQSRAQNLAGIQRAAPKSQRGAEGIELFTDLDEDKGFFGKIGQGLSQAASDPLKAGRGVVEVAAEQLPTIIAGGAVSLLTKSPIAGIGVMTGSTFAQERYGQLISTGQEYGYDLTNRGQALAAIKDEDFMKEQKQRGVARGTVIAAIDALTLGLAAKTPLSLLGVGKNTGTQAVAGGVGEAAGSYAATGEVDAGEVLVETFAEGVTAPADVAALGLRNRKAKKDKKAAEGSGLFSEDDTAELEADAANSETSAKDIADVANEQLELDLNDPNGEIATQQRAAAQAEQQAAAEKAQRLAQLDAQREAAKTFSKKDYIKQRNTLLEADAVNPNTPAGSAFKERIDALELIDEADIKAELKKFVGEQKPTDEEITAEHKEELNKRIALAQQNEGQAELDFENVAQDTTATTKPAPAVSAVPNEESQTATEDTRRTPFSNDAEFRSTLSPQQQKIYNAIIKSAEDSTLGDIFSVAFESGTESKAETKTGVSSAPAALTARRAKQKKLLKTGGVKEETLVKVFKKITKQLSAKDQIKFKRKTSSQPLRQDQQVKILEDAGVSNELITEFKEAATTQAKPKAAKERGFKIETNNAVLKSRSGITNASSAGTQASAVLTAMRNRYGEPFLREALAQAGVTEGVGIEVADAATSTDLVSESGMGLSTVATAGGSQVEGASAEQDSSKKAADTKRFKAAGMTDKQIAAFYDPQREADAAEAELAEQVLEDIENAKFAVENADKLLRTKWAASNAEGSPNYDDLSLNNKIDWMETVYATLGESNASEVLTKKANSLRGITDVTDQDNQVGRAEVQEPSGETVSPELSEDAGRRAETNAKPAESNAESKPKGFKGKLNLIHGFKPPNYDMVKGQQGKVAPPTFVPAEEFSGTRYDGDGGQYGSVGVYLENPSSGEPLIFNDPKMDNQFFAPATAQVEAPFENAFILDPTTVSELEALTGLDMSQEASGPEAAVRLKNLGYDGLIVRGFSEAEAKINAIYEQEQREGRDYSVPLTAKEEAIIEEAMKGFGGLSEDLAQNQIIHFNPEKLKTVKVFSKSFRKDPSQVNQIPSNPSIAKAAESFTAGKAKAPVVETKKKRKITKPKFSLDEAEAQATGTTANSIRDQIKWFIGKDANWRTSVVNSPEDLIGLVLAKKLNIDGLTLSSVLEKSSAQGTVVTDNDGVTRAFFFAENIAPGNERAAIAHELGGHIGMDNVLTSKQLETAATKIRDWASSDSTSLEKSISERALARLQSAIAKDAVSNTDSETIAYFLEEAVKAGITPNSDAKTDLVSFVRQLWSDFKRALRRLRPDNASALSAQDLVNMARGAARLELVTDFHGSSVPFRTVDQDYFGLGNNAIGVGFYVSEDQETGAEYMITRMDQRQATSGVLERIDNTIADNEFVIWKQPLSAQPDILATLQTEMSEDIQADLQEEMGGTSIENLTGRQMYMGLTALQLREYSIEEFVGQEAYDKANRLDTNVANAMAIASSYLDSLGVKGIKVSIAPNTASPNAVFNKIIFNADNAIVVGRNDAADVGTTTTTPGTIRFSVPESETQNQKSWVEKNFGAGAAEVVTNLREVGSTPLEATKNLDRLVRENQAKMPSARKWFDFMLAAEATRNEVLAMVEGVINNSRHLSRERQAMVNDFIGTSTFYQKWGYDPKWTDRKTGKAVKITVDPVMKKGYNKLTDEEQQIVRDVFMHGRTMQTMMQGIAENLGVSKFFKFDSKLQGPYAPLKRFGDYVGELKSQKLLDAEEALRKDATSKNRKALEELKADADHYVISFFDSLGAAQTFTNANQNKYASAVPSEKAVTYEEARPGGAQAYEKILGAVNANLAGLDQSSKDAMAKMVRDMYFQTLDDSNARLSGTKRLNRAGYDKDMLRSFAVHGMAQANLMAQMKHGANISGALVDAQKEARANATELMPVYNKIALKFQRVMTPRTGMFATIETNVMKFNSFYMLTSSLGYFFQNMTQPYFAVANIAGEFGWNQSKTWGKLFSGYTTAKKVINTGFLNQVKNVGTMGMLGGNSTVELDLSKAPPELRPVLKVLQLRGLLDVGITEDLRHVNMSPNVAIRAYDEMTHRLYQSARYVEANNRIASAVAAFKMAQLNPQTMRRLKMTPTEFAVQIVQDTQGNFSQLDAPAAFDVLPKAPLQFRKYQFQMGWLHIDAAKQAFKGANPDMKKAGFRKLSLMLGYTGVFGGLVSVPMANVASAVVQAVIGGLSGDDEENPPKSLERWVRENVEDERTATLLTRGVPAALGWDFSQKLDQSDLFMPYNSKYVQLDPSRDGSLLFAAQLFLGPSGTMVGNVGNIADFVNRGNLYRAAEYALPKGMRSYLETMRFAGQGYEERGGLTITDPTSFDVVDLLTNAIGLPSTDINQIKWTRGQQIEIEQWFSKKATRIKRKYLAAHESRDRKAMAGYRDEFRELQKAKDRVRPFFNNSRNVLKRSKMSELIRAPRARAREQRRLDSVTGN